jgi:hypothetical protein
MKIATGAVGEWWNHPIIRELKTMLSPDYTKKKQSLKIEFNLTFNI